MAVPPLAFETAAGDPASLDDYAGRVVVLNLWATWCAPCKIEMPTLGALQAEFDPEEVVVLALAIERRDPARLEEALAELSAGNLTLVRDPEMKAMRALGASGIPVTLVIDADGREVYRSLGASDWAAPEVVETLRKLAQSVRVET